MPFPDYDESIYNWIKAFYDLKLIDHNYIENFQYYKNKPIEELNIWEILSYFTHIIRNERFGDGWIASCLSNGTIELLEKNLFSKLIEFENLEDKSLEEFEEKNIMFFSLAESGAMGEPNGIKIIVKKNGKIKLYRTNLENFNVEKLYSKFSTLKTLKCGLFGIVTGVNANFVHFDTGAGNHLFVNDLISNEFQEKTKDLAPYEIYTRWLLIGLDILDYDWSSFNKVLNEEI